MKIFFIKSALSQKFLFPIKTLLMIFCLWSFILNLHCKKKSNEFQPFIKIKIASKISDYGLFSKMDSKNLLPNSKAIYYSLNSSLFSDYTIKDRLIFLPENGAMQYEAEKTFSFPVGSIITKTFSMPLDLQNPNSEKKRLETRVLIYQPEGWFAVSYIWNKEFTDAEISYEGKSIPIDYKNHKGEKKFFTYSVPSRNQCSSCHQVYEAEQQKIVPIGPKARHLNRDYEFHSDENDSSKSSSIVNQLSQFKKKGSLEGLPFFNIPKNVDFANKNESIENRARAYLDINCGHCHNKNSEAGMNSKLILSIEEKSDSSLGFCKTPGSAGKGGGGLRFDIVPGKAEESILYYRIKTNLQGAMMPQIGRALVHEEGASLIQEWISKMKPMDCK